MNLRRQTLEEKNIWNTHFFAYMRELDKTKPIIWAGDLNVAPTELGMLQDSASSSDSLRNLVLTTSLVRFGQSEAKLE